MYQRIDVLITCFVRVSCSVVYVASILVWGNRPRSKPTKASRQSVGVVISRRPILSPGRVLRVEHRGNLNTYRARVIASADVHNHRRCPGGSIWINIPYESSDGRFLQSAHEQKGGLTRGCYYSVTEFLHRNGHTTMKCVQKDVVLPLSQVERAENMRKGICHRDTDGLHLEQVCRPLISKQHSSLASGLSAPRALFPEESQSRN